MKNSPINKKNKSITLNLPIFPKESGNKTRILEKSGFAFEIPKDNKGKSNTSGRAKNSQHTNKFNYLAEIKELSVYKACQEKRVGIVEYLLKNGSPIGNSLYLMADGITVGVGKKVEAITALLLKYGANPNHIADKEQYSPLGIASLLSSANVVGQLVRANADLNHQNIHGDTALHHACYKGDPDKVRILLEAGADANICNKQKESPISNLCKFNGNLENYEKIVCMLIDCKAKPNIENNTHGNPLMTAAEKQMPGAVKKLLKAGADPNIVDEFAQTALHRACTGFHKNTALHEEIVSLLIKFGAKTDIQDACGRTPLMLACQQNNPIIVQKLLQAGADRNLKNQYDENAIDIAFQKKNILIIDLLQSYFPKSEAEAKTFEQIQKRALEFENEAIKKYPILFKGTKNSPFNN